MSGTSKRPLQDFSVSPRLRLTPGRGAFNAPLNSFIHLKTFLPLAFAFAFASAAFAADARPISSKPVDENVKSKPADGKTVYFCCPKCQVKYDKANKTK